MALCITELQDTCIVDEDQQLHLAGKLGQALLSENQMLKKEVRELKNAIATLENQNEHQKATFIEQIRELRSSQQSNLCQLEEQLDKANEKLCVAEERRKRMDSDSSAKDKQIRSLEDRLQILEDETIKLQDENLRLNSAYKQRCHLREASCVNEKEIEAAAVKAEAERITTEKRNLQCKLETVLKENSYLKNFAESLEIELTEALSHLQDKESEAADLSLELKEVRENLTQLQKEMEMQEIQAISPLSNVSIYEELCKVQVTDIQQSSTPNGPIHHTLFTGFAEDSDCERCEKLQRALDTSKEECCKLTAQVHALILQKIELSKQIEEWQIDVESMVDDNVTRQLKEDCVGNISTPSAKAQEPVKSSSERKRWTKRFFKGLRS